MTRRSSNKSKRNQKAKAKPAPSEHETSTTSNDALDDGEASGSQSPTRNLQAADTTPSPSGAPPREVSVENMDVDEDSTPPPAPNASRTRGSGRGHAQQAPEAPRVEGEESLYQALFNGKSTPRDIVDKWIVEYEINKDDGLRMLMQFFIEASGCKGVITPAMLSLQHTQLINRMTREFDEENAVYPLVATGLQYKKFKINYCKFVECWVDQCKEFILYDNFIMDYAISLLVGLSDSQVRAFRHTTTLAVMKMMSALAEVAVGVFNDLKEAKMQFNAESKGEKNPDRMESLAAEATEVQEKWDELRNMLYYSYDSVFIQRYRDLLPEIRTICIEEMGVCMTTLPEMFFNDSKLKYISWLLYDKAREVRLKCVKVLQSLYNNTEQSRTEMEAFTKKFRERLLAMILDIENDVGVEAVKLVASMEKYGHVILSEEECQRFYELMYCANRALAQAAGEFVINKIFASNENFEMETQSGKKRLPNTPFIKDLVLLSIESELSGYEPYFVDSLIGVTEMMKDWKCMTDLLLEEPGPNESENLDSQKETTLIKIMACCIKQAVTGELPDGRGPARKFFSAKETRQLQAEKQKMTEHFIGLLPLLLEKYHEDSDKLVNLMSIPRYFELDIYSAVGQQENLDSLMERITQIVGQTINAQVLDAASKTLEYMCTSESPIFAKCEEVKSNIIKFIVKNYTEAMGKVTSAVEGGSDPCDLDVLYAQEELTKIACFSSCHNLNDAVDWDSVFKNIRERVLTAEAIRYSITGCFFSMIWLQNEITESTYNDNLGSRFKYDTLKRRLRDFMKCAGDFIATNEVSAVIRDEAYRSVCDLLLMFKSSRVDQSNPQQHQVVFEPDVNWERNLNNFVQQRVFTEEQEDLDERSKEERLHNNRNFLAGYCKLIIGNVFSADAAADVFKRYLEYGKDYGDIIKMTISKVRDYDKVACAVALQRSLNILYHEIAEERADTSSDEFKSVKELAKRFALFFGTDPVKNRDAIVTLHKRGIMFAASMPDGARARGLPQNLIYLEILNEFTYKLTKQDKKTVLLFLGRHLKEGTPEEDWKSLLLYKKVLSRNSADKTAVDMSISL